MSSVVAATNLVESMDGCRSQQLVDIVLFVGVLRVYVFFVFVCVCARVFCMWRWEVCV